MDRVQKERGREEEKEGGRERRSKEGRRRERNVGGRAGDTALQWILNIVLDMFIDKATITTQTFIQLRWILDIVLDMFMDKADTTTRTFMQCATSFHNLTSTLYAASNMVKSISTVTADIREMHDGVSGQT